MIGVIGFAIVIALGVAWAVTSTILSRSVENPGVPQETYLRIDAKQAGKPYYWLGADAPLDDVPAISDGAELVPQIFTTGDLRLNLLVITYLRPDAPVPRRVALRTLVVSTQRSQGEHVEVYASSDAAAAQSARKDILAALEPYSPS